MAYYKLFCIIFRRTDYNKLHEKIIELLYPQRFEEQSKLARDGLVRLAALSTLVKGLSSSDWAI